MLHSKFITSEGCQGVRHSVESLRPGCARAWLPSEQVLSVRAQARAHTCAHVAHLHTLAKHRSKHVELQLWLVASWQRCCGSVWERHTATLALACTQQTLKLSCNCRCMLLSMRYAPSPGNLDGLLPTQGNRLVTSWVGDSRAVLGRQNKKGAWEAHDLTSDHKPTTPEEKARIIRSNGRVERWARLGRVESAGVPMGDQAGRGREECRLRAASSELLY